MKIEMKSKNKKKPNEYYDILITSEGNIFIQPFGNIVESFVKNFKIPKRNTKMSLFCG